MLARLRERNGDVHVYECAELMVDSNTSDGVERMIGMRDHRKAKFCSKSPADRKEAAIVEACADGPV